MVGALPPSLYELRRDKFALPPYSIAVCGLICLPRKRKFCAASATNQPDGQITLIFRNRVKPFAQKYSASHLGQISRITPPVSPDERGARERHERAVGCGGRESCDRRVWLERTAKSCGSDVAVLALSSREAKLLGGDGGKRAVRRGEHEVSRKAIAQGRPGCSACTCMLVCAFLVRNCTRDRGCSVHPVFPAPSSIREGNRRRKTRAKDVARRRNYIHVIASAAKQSTSPLAAVWIASLRSQ